MTDVAQAIRERLAALEPEALDLVDESALHAGHAGAASGGGHYRLTIVSPRFRGHGTLARHRMVYGALGAMMRPGDPRAQHPARSPPRSGRAIPITLAQRNTHDLQRLGLAAVTPSGLACPP